MIILTLCGSLRARSSNRAMLLAYERLAPESMRFVHYEGVGALPHFNPDNDNETVPAEVRQLRRLISESDVVLISTPEYAHALPGSFKNALDWLVSDPGIFNKPVVILNASRGSNWALDSLKEVLRTMSARLPDSACVSVPLGSNQVQVADMIDREDIRKLFEDSIAALLK